MITEATKRNLQRKSAYVDVVQWYKGLPLFSLLELSLTELCNRSFGHPRACKFCPRIDPAFYPNQNMHMALSLVDGIVAELCELNFRGTVVLCGYGEPTLHPQLTAIVRALRFVPCRVEIVTSGDFLSVKRVRELRNAGVDYFVVSLYDGVEQVERFSQMFTEALGSEEGWLLRDRWHTEADQFGLMLTNRAGAVQVGKQDPVDTNKTCHYLAYQMTVDWNGDVVLCPQDWHKRIRFGNLNTTSLWDAWTDKRMEKRRQQLFAGRRIEHPCRECNADGTLHGFNHVDAWLK